MFQLSDQQIDIVCSRLQGEGIADQKLEQDLVDHFCCHMEEHMEEGADFEQAFKEATTAISPNGVKEIEFELYFILNFKKQLSMKRFIFLAGFAAAFLLSTGTMFKTLHWPGANIILFSGFSSLLLAALGTVAHLLTYLRDSPTSFWFRTVTGVSAATLISLGSIFKLLSFPGANIMYTLGILILNFVFLPLFFYHVYKSGFVKIGSEQAA
jgi:ABC-type multidrug transport system fused ATPase/permease subunit